MEIAVFGKREELDKFRRNLPKIDPDATVEPTTSVYVVSGYQQPRYPGRYNQKFLLVDTKLELVELQRRTQANVEFGIPREL